VRDAAPTKGKVLLVSCPFEVLPDGPDRKPDAARLPGISQALSMLGYDAGVLNPDEADALQNARAPLPKGFIVLASRPSTKVIKVGDLTVGLVFFPTVSNPREPVPAADSDAVATAAAGLRGKSGLIIGISGWGMADEEAFLSVHPGTLDVLLGSGPSAGLAGRPTANGMTLWSRAYIKGKTINRLDILSLPGAGDFAWKSDKTFKADIVSLDDTYPADPSIQKLFE
jgi:hypothetical protein